MAISNTTDKAIYSGNGVTATFSIPFDIIDSDEDEVEVYLVDESADPITETLQTLTTDYTLTTPGSDGFATIVEFNSAPANGLKILIRRALALTQPVDNSGTSTYAPLTAEKAYDRIVAQIQELREMLSRAFLLRKSTPVATDGATLPQEAGGYLKWSADGTVLETDTTIAPSGGGDFKSDGSVKMAADLDFGSNKGTNLSTPTNNADAATKKYVDDSIASISMPDTSGFVYTDGSRPFSGDQSMGGNALTNVKDPSAAGDAANKDYVDDAVAAVAATVPTLPTGIVLANGSQAMEADLELGGHRIKNLANPSNDHDAIPKLYLDARLAALIATMGVLHEGLAIGNNTTAPIGVSLDKAAMKHALIEYNIRRITTGTVEERVCAGAFRCVYNSTADDWELTPTEEASDVNQVDCGVEFSIDNAGIISYTSDNMTTGTYDDTNSIATLFVRSFV